MRETQYIKKNKNCRGCGSTRLKLWFGLGNQPLANNLVYRKNLKKKENKFPLTLYYCQKCTLVQLIDIVNPKLLFDDYLYYSSTSPVFVEHFKQMASDFKKAGMYKTKLFGKSDLVIDIGSNDGIALKEFKKKGANVLGIEPAKEIAMKAMDDGILTIPEYFNSKLAKKIVDKFGEAKIVIFTNVFAHIDNSREMLKGVSILLKAGGTLVLEFPYLPIMLQEGTFDLIYHEHLSYFTRYSIEKLLEKNGFGVSKTEIVPVHGGSLRVFYRHIL